VSEDDDYYARQQQQQRQLIPRGEMSVADWRYQHHQNYRPLLALPPSTNCPVSFKEMYRSATMAVRGESDVGGVLKQHTKQKNSSSNNKRQKNPTNNDSDTCLTTLLHEDVIPQILSYCDAITLSRASCVCRSWYKLANDDTLWTTLCKEVFGVLPIELRPPPDPTRILYILSYLKLRETLSFGSGGGRSRRHGMDGSSLFTNSIPTIFHVG
jgi:hypothetical protein